MEEEWPLKGAKGTKRKRNLILRIIPLFSADA